jgi:hypothetical protein
LSFAIIFLFSFFHHQNLSKMKKLNFLTSLVLGLLLLGLAVQDLHAQAAPKGAWMIGGEASFNSTSYDGESTTSLTVAPGAGYFIINNLAVGASIGLGTAEDVTTFGIGPFVRYYVWNNLFATAGLQYTSLKVKDVDAVTSTRFGGGVGYSFFLNEGVAIEPAINVDFGDEVTNFSIGIGIQAFLNRE